MVKVREHVRGWLHGHVANTHPRNERLLLRCLLFVCSNKHNNKHTTITTANRCPIFRTPCSSSRASESFPCRRPSSETRRTPRNRSTWAKGNRRTKTAPPRPPRCHLLGCTHHHHHRAAARILKPWPSWTTTMPRRLGPPPSPPPTPRRSPACCPAGARSRRAWMGRISRPCPTPWDCRDFRTATTAFPSGNMRGVRLIVSDRGVCVCGGGGSAPWIVDGGLVFLHVWCGFTSRVVWV